MLFPRFARSSSRSDAPCQYLDVVSNVREFLYLNELVTVKKLAHEYSIQLGSWNIGSRTGRLIELVDVMIGKKINILSV